MFTFIIARPRVTLAPLVATFSDPWVAWELMWEYAIERNRAFTIRKGELYVTFEQMSVTSDWRFHHGIEAQP